jgi:O-antigen/teichoic acid export membrane protein
MVETDEAGDVRWRTAMRSGATGSVARLVTLVLAFVLTPVTITHAGPTTYGLLITLTSFAGLLTFADFGVGNGLISRLATARAAGDSATEKSATAAALAILVVVGVAVAVVGIVLAVTLRWHSLIHTPITDDHSIRVAMVVASVAIGFGVPGALAQKIYLGQQRAGLASAWLNVAAALAAVGVVVAAVNGHHLAVMVAMALGVPAVVALTSLTWLASRGAVPSRLRMANVSSAWTMLRVGRMYAVLQLVVVVNFEVDNLVVAHFMGPAKVAVFAASSRLAAIPLTLATLFFTPLWAAYTDAIARGDLAWVRTAYQRATRGSLYALVPAATALAIAGPWAVRVWTRGSIQSPRLLMAAWAVWLIVFALNQPQAMLLNALHDERFQVSTAVCNAVVNLSLSILATIRFGVAGPILGSIVAQVSCALIPTSIHLWHRLASASRPLIEEDR